jgi:hypothetical protein
MPKKGAFMAYSSEGIAKDCLASDWGAEVGARGNDQRSNDQSVQGSGFRVQALGVAVVTAILRWQRLNTFVGIPFDVAWCNVPSMGSGRVQAGTSPIRLGDNDRDCRSVACYQWAYSIEAERTRL